MGCNTSKYETADDLLQDLKIHGLKAKLSDVDSSINVSWDAVRDIGSEVFVQAFKNGLEVGDATECAGKSFKYDQVEPLSKYQFKVWIENEGDEGKPSVSKVVYSRPNKLENVKAKTCGEHIIVNWDKPEWQFKYYRVEVFLKDKSILRKKLDVCRYCVRYCKPSSCYRVLVKAKAFNGVYSVPVQTEVTFPPPPVSSLKLKPWGLGFEATWHQCKTVTSCHVKVYKERQCVKEVHDVTCQSFLFPELECEPSSKYRVQVYSKNLADLVGPVEEKVFYSEISPIQGLVTSEKNGQIELAWNKPKENNLEYKIKVSKKGRLRKNVFFTCNVFNKNEALFKIPGKEGRKYYFEIKAKNSYNKEGETEKISHICSGQVMVMFHILVNAEHHVITLCGSDEDTLQEDLQKCERDGYKPAHVLPLSVSLHPMKKYKNYIQCRKKDVKIFPKYGHKMQEHYKLAARPVAFNFCLELKHNDEYILEFKLEEDALEGKTLRTEPFKIKYTAENQLAMQNHVEAGVYVNGGSVDVNMNGRGAFNVGTHQRHVNHNFSNGQNPAQPDLETGNNSFSNDTFEHDRDFQNTNL